SARITDDLTLDALAMALARRRPPPGLLHHSDRGSQYASGDYQQVLARHGVVCSMSRRGNCWDNAVAESFFATLKVELVHDAAWTTRNRGAHRTVRIPRALLQRVAATFGARLPQPPSVRAPAGPRSTGNLTQMSNKPRQLQS